MTSYSFNVNESLGATYIGILVASALWGVTCVQTFLYYGRYPSDPWYIKVLVASIFCFDTFHQGLISHAGYHLMVIDYDKPLNLLYIEWSVISEVAINGVTAMLVQGFLTWRIWLLSYHNIPITATIFLLIIIGFGATIAYTVLAMRLTFMPQLDSLKHLSMSINAIGVITDISIAVTLCIQLLRSSSESKRGENIVTKLIIYVVNTGMCTSICAVGSLVSILVRPDALIYPAFFFSLGRLYANSCLATLNARQSIHGAFGSPGATTSSRPNLTNLTSMFPSKDIGNSSSADIKNHMELNSARHVMKDWETELPHH